MLVIAGEIEIDAAHRDKAIAAAREMMTETYKEPGCKTYVFSTDLSDPGKFRIFEEWESQEALDAHFVAPHMAKFGASIAEIGVKGISVQKYQVSSVGPVR
jgi:quinol monooxygenase YgiN